MSRTQKTTTVKTEGSGSFLQRGGNKKPAADAYGCSGGSPPPPQFATEPSVIFDEETGTAVAIGGGGGMMTAAHHLSSSSLPASQLFSSQAVGGSAAAVIRLTRQRPRFHTVQDLDLALNQAIEGRINSKNAWASKEASDLLEGITHTIESTLDANTADDYSGFTKAATVVEGCSKVWTVRVDSTYHQTNQMVQRLLRNEETTSTPAGGSGTDNDNENDTGEETQSNRRKRDRAAAAAAAAAAARTLALNAAEINLDSKGRTALTQTGINAQFRAITEKFDQGNAQGLLLNNAPLGSLGNVILDVDYARVQGQQFSAKKTRQLQKLREAEEEAELDNDSDEGVATVVKRERNTRNGNEEEEGGGEGAVVAGRSSTQYVERDTEIGASLDDLPDLTTVIAHDGSLIMPAISRVSGSGVGGSTGAVAAASVAASPRASGVIDSLLVLPHAAMKPELAAEVTGSRRQSLERLSTNNAAGDGTIIERSNGYQNDDHDDDGGGGYDDGGGGYDDDTTANTTNPRDVGQEARHLVSGLSEMQAMDNYFTGRRLGNSHDNNGEGDEEEEGGGDEEGGGPSLSGRLLASTGGIGAHQQLALEAEDPSAWCPLTDASTNRLAGFAPNSELSRLRRQHRVIAGAGAGGTSSTGGSSVSAAATAGQQQQQQPLAKRGRRDKTVVFDLSDVKDLESTDATFAVSKEDVDGSALKQSTTATKNSTALGKEVLLARDAAQAVLQYTQSGYQRRRAEQANLVMPADPVPGESIPSLLAFPITIGGFFQPFCTSQPSWNLLRKSAAGSLIDISGTAASVGGGGRKSSAMGVDGTGGVAGGQQSSSDMPVAFFASGAEVDDIDNNSGGGGGHDADANDFYGGGYDDGNDGDDSYDEFAGMTEEEAAYRRAELQLLRQFDAQQQNAAAGTTSSANFANSNAMVNYSNRASGVLSSARHSGELLALMDPMDLVRVLQSPEAVLPTQVDVVALRLTMWAALRELASIAVEEKAGEEGRTGNRNNSNDGDDDDDDEEEESEGEEEAQVHRPRDKESLLKHTALRLLASTANKKRKKSNRKQQESIIEESESGSEEEEESNAATPRPKNTQKRVRVDDNVDDDESDNKDEEEDALDDHIGNYARSGRLRFSHVVEALLPQVPVISSTGTLSPAFFFFSILFLANEHNVVLKNVKSLDDLVVDLDSLVKGGGEIQRSASSRKRQKTARGQTAARA